MTPLILFDNGPGGEPALFRAPARIIDAWEPDEVAPAFAAVEQARAEGSWLAGFAPYELGYVLEPGLGDLLPQTRATPLLRFGVFDAPEPASRLEATLAREAGTAALGEPACDWSFAQYSDAFRVVREGIAAGDYYQVNLTMRLRMRLEGTPLALYAAMPRDGPVAHGAYVDLGAPVLSRARPSCSSRSRPSAPSVPFR